MRLICPNCDAQYEVDDDAVPDVGRDVQCSNCGHGWYQYPPGMEPDPESGAGDDDAGDDRDEAPAAAAAEETPTEPAAPAMPEPPATPEPSEAATFDDAEATWSAGLEEAPFPAVGAEPADPPQPSGPTGDAPPEIAAEESASPMRRALDDSVLAVLREEAEREAEARRAEAEPRTLETQSELGLTEKRVRRIIPTAAAEPDAAEGEGPRGSRRDLLPDIEQINSTLSASSERRDGAADGATLPEPPEARRRGFRVGFVGVMLIVVVLLGLYAMTPRIVTAVPALEGPMNAYVATVDRGRIELDNLMQRALGAMQGGAGPDAAQEPET